MALQSFSHNRSVHRQYYCLPENTLQTAKVGKLLIAIESGISKYQGKKLDEIEELSDIEEEEEEEEEMEGEGCLIIKKVCSNQ